MNTCLFNSTTECKHEACFESQEIACCYACPHTDCKSNCKNNYTIPEEIPPAAWDNIVKKWRKTNNVQEEN